MKRNNPCRLNLFRMMASEPVSMLMAQYSTGRKARKPDAKVKGVIYGAEAWQIGDIQDKKAMQETYDAGENL